MLEDGFFDPHKPVQIRWGDLPHWRQDGALYFVTFRLADSLPQSKLVQWREERDAWRAANPRPSREEVEQFSLLHRRRVEEWLDRGYGSGILREPPAKVVVESAMRHFEGQRYELGEIAVAPNHAHVLVRTALGFDLSRILGSWKRHSSMELRKFDEVRRHFPRGDGHLWQVESFDHIVRNRKGLERFTAYIQNHERPT